MDLIDITYPVSKRLPTWPGSIGFSTTWHMRMPTAGNNLSSVQMDCHLGTHLDAPLHFVHNGKSIDQLDLNKLVGPVFVVELRGVRSITAQHLQAAAIASNCKRLLLKTDNQQYWTAGNTVFQEDFCSIDSSGAQWIVDRGIVLVGIDYLSIQRFHDSPLTHTILLKAEVVIVETLNLEHVTAGEYELICLPLKLEGLEGAPVRAVLKKCNRMML